MKKKILILSVIFAFFAFPAFSNIGFEFGIGSGYIFYGDEDVKDRNKALGDTNQTILKTDALLLLPLNYMILFDFGLDGVFDFRWNGSNHIYLIDYSFLAGFRLYPNLGGLFLSIDYALGRRSDFISMKNEDDTLSTSWGNGFKFTVGYDFSYHLNSLGPVLAAGIRSMPRGGSRDTLFCVSLKLTKHK